MIRRFLSATLLLVICVGVTSAQIFSETWDDGAGATRWSDPIVALENPPLGFDGSVDYAFDYSAIGAGPAPNSAGTTIGVAMETNTTDAGDVDEGESVGIVPLPGLADIPLGNFRITGDMYLFWNGLPGSTEYGTIGAFSNGNAVPLRFNLDQGDGLAWQFDSDGDSGTDMLRYENPPPLETGLGGYEGLDCGSIPNVNVGPDDGTCYPGNALVGPVNQWVAMEIESISGIVSVKMNGTTIDSFDNTSPQFSGGTLLIGQSDPFNSVNFDDANGNSNMVVWDNIVLEVPEPSGLGLLLVSLIALAARRR